jgi:hypothetical protein
MNEPLLTTSTTLGNVIQGTAAHGMAWHDTGTARDQAADSARGDVPASLEDSSSWYMYISIA